jgi:hypothetical protein
MKVRVLVIIIAFLLLFFLDWAYGKSFDNHHVDVIVGVLIGVLLGRWGRSKSSAG